MVTEFQLNYDEFCRELDALEEVVAASRATTSSSRARVAAANATTLLLAAVFEEYVRQQVRSAFREKASRANGLDAFPGKIANHVWRESLEIMLRWSSDESEWQQADSKISAMLAFCVRKQLSADVADVLAHNARNMRPEQLKELFGRIGVSAIMSRSCTDVGLADMFGTTNPDQLSKEVEGRFEGFFKRRNNIAHAIVLGSSSGPSELLQETQLFRAFGGGLFRALEGEFSAAGSRAAAPAVDAPNAEGGVGEAGTLIRGADSTADDPTGAS